MRNPSKFQAAPSRDIIEAKNSVFVEPFPTLLRGTGIILNPTDPHPRLEFKNEQRAKSMDPPRIIAKITERVRKFQVAPFRTIITAKDTPYVAPLQNLIRGAEMVLNLAGPQPRLARVARRGATREADGLPAISRESWGIYRRSGKPRRDF